MQVFYKKDRMARQYCSQGNTGRVESMEPYKSHPQQCSSDGESSSFTEKVLHLQSRSTVAVLDCRGRSINAVIFDFLNLLRGGNEICCSASLVA